MFQTSQQLHDIFNAYSPLYVFVKIQPILTEQWAVKAIKVGKNQTQVWHSLTSLWTQCLAARPLPKWQECTRLGCVHPVFNDAMGVRVRTVRGIVYDGKAQKKTEHVKDKPRSSRPRITTLREDTSLMRIARQRRYAASKTIRNLRNVGRPTASRTVRNRPKKADCMYEDLIESHYSHNGTERCIKNDNEDHFCMLVTSRLANVFCFNCNDK